jgi:hypothetical protein
MEEIINIAFYFTYAILFVGVLAALILPLISAFDEPKNLIKSGIGIGALVLLYFIAYAISGSEVSARYADFGVGETASKFIGGALIMMYLMGVILIISIIYTEISKILK